MPSELSGGRFCEIVYTVLMAQAAQIYSKVDLKPPSFGQACQKLENNDKPHVPRSFRILIPRIFAGTLSKT